MSSGFIKSGEPTRYCLFSGAQSTAVIAASTPILKESPFSTFQAIVTGVGVVSATVVVEVSNEDATFTGTKSNWIGIGTITLTGATTATDGFTSICPWKYVRANVTAVVGAVQLLMGV